jgi:hypothetical protein
MIVAHGGENVFQLANENRPGQSEPAAMQELRDLADRARRGDEAAMPRLRAIFDEQPEVATWLGDLARRIRRRKHRDPARPSRRRSPRDRVEAVDWSPTNESRQSLGYE